MFHSIKKHLALVSFCLVGLLAIPSMLQAQQMVDPTSAKEMKTLLESFADDYRKMKDTKDKATVLRHIDKGLSYSIYTQNIAGRSRMLSGKYKEFESYLTHLSRVTVEELKYEVSEVNVSLANGQFGAMSYKVDFETKEAGGVWVKGQEAVSMAMTKKEGKWYISHYNIIQVEDEKFKGTCLTELFASAVEGGEMVARTTLPIGQTYTTKFDNFAFTPSKDDEDNEIVLITTGESVFKRMSDGTLLAMDGDEWTKIGIVRSKKESIVVIIRDGLYADSCSNLKVR